MLKLQQLLLTIGGTILFVLGVIMAWQNWPTAVNVILLQWALPGFSLGLIMLVAGIVFGIAISLYTASLAALLGARQRRAERELERKEVDREEASGRVKALEAKVETLEKALGEALKNRS